MSRNKNEENQMRNKGVMTKESEIMPKMRFLVTATLGAYQREGTREHRGLLCRNLSTRGGALGLSNP